MEYGYTYDPSSFDQADVAAGIFGGFMLIYTIVSLIVAVLTIVGMWKTFTKAGKPGWASIIPIYNIIVMLEIAELPMWYLVLYIIPFANFVALFLTFIGLAHKFGKSTGFGVLTVFFMPICLLILGFDSSVYQGGNTSSVVPVGQTPVNNVNNMAATASTIQPVENTMEQVSSTEPAPVENVVEPTPVVAPVNEVPVQPVGAAPIEPTPVVEQAANIICPTCGSQVSASSEFCENCGSKLK